MLNISRVILFAVLGLLTSWLVARTDIGERIDWTAYDQLFRLRHLHGAGPQVDERLVILEIDEDTRQQIADPIALWVPLYARALEALHKADTELVAFDIIPTYAPKDRLLPFAEAALRRPGKLIMVAFYDFETSRLIAPAPGIRAVVGDQNLGISNQTRDSDGIFRRQTLTDYSLNGEVFPFLARLMYERLTGRTELPDTVVVNFAGPAGSIPRISFGELVRWLARGDTKAIDKAFAGKVVLLGGTARIDLDFVETPFPSRHPMPGVEMHANVLNTLLSGQLLRESAAWWLLGLLLLPVSWAALERPVTQSAPMVILLAVGWTVGLYLAFMGNIIASPRFLALIAFFVTYLLAYLYRFNTVEREQRRIRYVFGRYVSRDVMEAMLKVPGDHRPELAKRRRVTVMFSDINHFSTACEKLEPEEVAGRLNHYFSEMTNILFDHQGTIIRFIGDEFMVLFGAPRKTDKNEELAVLAAVRMVERLKELRKEDPQGERGFYEVRIGIHVGDMILTSIGNEVRSDYNCIGDSANLAARVLSHTKPLDATVLVSEDVKNAVGQHPLLRFEDRGLHSVKGRAREVRLFEAFLEPGG